MNVGNEHPRDPSADLATDVDLAWLIRSAWRQRGLVLRWAFGVAIGLAAVSLLMTPKFRATVVMAPAPEQQDLGLLGGLAASLGGLTDLAGLHIGSMGDIDQAIAVLQSRSFIEQFLVEEEVLPHLYPDLWDPVGKKWRTGSPTLLGKLRDLRRSTVQLLSRDDQPAGTRVRSDGSPSLWFAYDDFSTLLRIRKDRQTNLVTLQVTWKDPAIAATWANGLVSRANEYMRRQAREEARRSREYLDRQIEKTESIGLREGLYRLAENELRKSMLVDVRDEYAFRVLDPAIAPEQRDSPRRATMTIGGFILGGLIGTLLAVARALRAARTQA